MEGMIEITGADLTEVVKAAYDLSRPQGLGAFHFQPGGLSDDEAALLVQPDHKHCPVSLDYVRGRSCKLTVFRDEDGLLWIDRRWYDHTDEQLAELLLRIGVTVPAQEASA